MIVSHKHKFIFIKTRKTAGTSIEIALSAHCGDEDILSPLNEEDEKLRREVSGRGAQNYKLPYGDLDRQEWLKVLKTRKQARYYNHMSAAELKRHLGDEIWNSYYKFTLDRNPFDKVVSLFYWRGGFEKYPSLKDFILQGGLAKMDSYDLYSIDKIPAMDTIYRYEEMQAMAADLSSRFVLEPALDFNLVKAKGGIRKKRNYQDLYDEETVQLVEQAFAREIKLLDYQY